MSPVVDVAQELHDEAQAVASEAVLARFEGRLECWKRLMWESAALDRAAAACAQDTPEYPMRTRRLQDAAQKYISCQHHDEARAVITAALAENPPAIIFLQLHYLLDSMQKGVTGGTRG